MRRAALISCSVGFLLVCSNAAACMIMPLMQYPHCTACSSMNALCSGCNWPGPPRPSSVTIFLPAMVATGITHERVALPSTSTVHAPHWPRPQPKRGPCRPRSSRNAYNRGICGSSAVIATGLPLTFRVIFIAAPPRRTELAIVTVWPNLGKTGWHEFQMLQRSIARADQDSRSASQCWDIVDSPSTINCFARCRISRSETLARSCWRRCSIHDSSMKHSTKRAVSAES